MGIKVLLSVMTVFMISSCTTWDNGLSNEDKAAFLYEKLNEQYKKAVEEEDLVKIRDITRQLINVYKLDQNKKDKVEKLIASIESNLETLKKNIIKKADVYMNKKDIFNAAVEYKIIIDFEPGNSQAKAFFKTNNDRINEVIVTIKVEVKRSIDSNNINYAENTVNKLVRLTPNDREVKNLLYELDRKKETNANKTASKSAIRKTANPEPYYANALKLFNDRKYGEAKKEILKYLAARKNSKGQDLLNRINSEIKRVVNDLMGDAVLNYNSQKYDTALKLFNSVLELEYNSEARDYKNRIERKLNALDVL